MRSNKQFHNKNDEKKSEKKNWIFLKKNSGFFEVSHRWVIKEVVIAKMRKLVAHLIKLYEPQQTLASTIKALISHGPSQSWVGTLFSQKWVIIKMSHGWELFRVEKVSDETFPYTTDQNNSYITNLSKLGCEFD